MEPKPLLPFPEEFFNMLRVYDEKGAIEFMAKNIDAFDVNAIERDNSDTPLICAVCNKDVQVCIALITTYKADVNKPNIYGNTPILLACVNMNLNIVDLLLAHHVDVEKPSNNGYTPLAIACAYNQLNIAIDLLAHGANPNVGTDSKNPLYVVCYEGYLPILIELVKHKIDLHQTFGGGETALTIATKRKKTPIVEFLERQFKEEK